MSLVALPSRVSDLISMADIVVVEGFEMTGKSTLVHKLVDRFLPSTIYRPDWEGVLNTDIVSRGNRHIPGLAVVDAWRHLIEDEVIPYRTLILDRWMASSFVYSKMYDQVSDATSDILLSKAFTSAVGSMNLIIIHKCHANSHDALVMYESARRTSEDHNDIYDKFETFDDYYRVYQEFEEKYDEFYNSKLNPFSYIKVSSISNELI